MTDRLLSRGELRWAALVSALVVAVSCLPYLFGWWLRPADFMGHVYNADDACVHLSWMRQAAEGRWLVTDRFTSEPQQPQFFHLFAFVLGRLAGLFGGSYQALILVYHAARVLFGWLLLVSVYLLASYVYASVQTRRLALVLAGTASGVGWLLNLLHGPGAYSCDFGTGLVMPEAITFLSLYIFPLFAASMLLIVAAYGLLLRAFDTGRPVLAVASGVLVLVLGNIHTYDVLPLYAALVVYLVALGVSRRAVPWREAGLAAIVVGISLPAPVYQFLVFRSNPVFQQKALTPTLSPGLLQYALTYGLLLGAAVVGVGALRQIGSRRGGFLVVWAVVTFTAAYLPVSFQRKLIEGVHIPMALLAASGWLWLGERLRCRSALWPALLVVLAAPSNVAMMAESARRLVSNNAEGTAVLLPPYYLDTHERAALDWLRQHDGPSNVVLSSPLTGCYMPPWAGVTTYVSHWAETMDLPTKLRDLRSFYEGHVDDAWRARFLRDTGIRFVYYGHAERALGDYDPARARFLRAVFASGPVTLYEVAMP